MGFPGEVAFGDGPESPDRKDSVSHRKAKGHEGLEGEFEEGIVFEMGCYVGVNEVNGKDGGGSEVEPDAPEDDGFGAGIGGVGVGVMIGGLHLPGVGAG